jgi:ABC-type uncharacterized transport system permease subunit
MNMNKPDPLLTFIFGVFAGVILLSIVMAVMGRNYRNEAIANGSAVYVLEKPTEPIATFKWKCDIKEEKK